jgi:hypothetical protein
MGNDMCGDEKNKDEVPAFDLENLRDNHGQLRGGFGNSHAEDDKPVGHKNQPEPHG